MHPSPDKRIDCIGLYCPVPIVRTREAIREMAAGQSLEMLSDDPAAEMDVRSWAARTGHLLLDITRHGTVSRFLIRKVG
jgi:tRNA 2-thiouridine synthesizing protein A